MKEVENKSCEEEFPKNKFVKCLKEACEQVSLKGIDTKTKFEEQISDRIVDKLKNSKCEECAWLREFPVKVQESLLKGKSSIEYEKFEETLNEEKNESRVNCKNINSSPMATCSSRVDIMCTDLGTLTIIFNSEAVMGYCPITSVQDDFQAPKNLLCTIEVKQTFPYHNNIDVIALETNGRMLGQVIPDDKDTECNKHLKNGMWFVEDELRSDISKRHKIDALSKKPFIWILAVADTKPGGEIQAIFHDLYSYSKNKFSQIKNKGYTNKCIDALNRDYIADLFKDYFGENCWCKFTNECENITFYLGYAQKLNELSPKIRNNKQSFCKNLFQKNSQI